MRKILSFVAVFIILFSGIGAYSQGDAVSLPNNISIYKDTIKSKLFSYKEAFFKLTDSDTENIDNTDVAYQNVLVRAYCGSGKMRFLYYSYYDKDGNCLYSYVNDDKSLSHYKNIKNGKVYFKSLCGQKAYFKTRNKYDKD